MLPKGVAIILAPHEDHSNVDVIVFDHHPDIDVDSVIEELLSEVEGITSTEPADVVIGGAPGKTIEISAGIRTVTFEYLPDTELAVSPGPALHIHVLAVGVETVVITVYPTATSTAFYDEAQAVLDSIVWRDLR